MNTGVWTFRDHHNKLLRGDRTGVVAGEAMTGALVPLSYRYNARSWKRRAPVYESI